MQYRRLAIMSISVFSLMCFGVGCKKAPQYVPAPPSTPIEVPPTKEGAQASTGGYDTTLTPQLESALLAAALPSDQALPDFEAKTPVEEKQPVPLPDGTRGEYSTLKKTYVQGSSAITVSIIDTRGLPVLTSFVQSYQPYESPSGSRWEVVVGDGTGWMMDSKSPDTDTIIACSFLMLYRGRFIIQMSGNTGISTENLLTLARALDLKQLQ